MGVFTFSFDLSFHFFASRTAKIIIFTKFILYHILFHYIYPSLLFVHFQESISYRDASFQQQNTKTDVPFDFLIHLFFS